MNLKDILSKVSPSIFALIIICFFLPFTTVSCQNAKIATLSGFQVATGAEIDQTSGLASSLGNMKELQDLQKLSKDLAKSAGKKAPKQQDKQDQKIKGNPIAGIVFAMACAGIAMSFVGIRQKALIQAAIAGVGAVMMFLLKLTIDGEITKQGGGIFRVDYEIGYWLTFLLFIGAIGVNGYRYWLNMQDS